MKSTILTIFIVFALAGATFAQGQQPATPNYNPQYEAGVYLKKFSHQYFLGIGLSVGGYAITILSVRNNPEDPSASLLGGLLIVAGGVFTIVSHANIGKAGEHLMMSSQQVGFSDRKLNSLGWSFNIGNKRKSRQLKLLAANR